MPSTYYPNNDADFIVWLANFVTGANANLAALGLVAADLTPVTGVQPTYSTQLNDVESKKAALASAVASKNATKESVIQKVRAVVNKIQANPAVTPAMKSQLGISTREGGQYPQNPIAPTHLVANLLPDGRIKLNWNRNGNAPTALFIIEYRLMPAGNWTLLDFVSKTSYIHAGYPVGTIIEYVVKARKTTKTSSQSNIAIIDAGNGV